MRRQERLGAGAGRQRGSGAALGVAAAAAGVGPVEKFADLGDTPQGKFLEGGAFDNDGNLWFVAIGSGWVSYLKPDGKLVPAVNCNPPDDMARPASRRAPAGTTASST